MATANDTRSADPKARLAELEAEAKLLPFDEILKYLDDCNVCVSLDLVEGHGEVNAEVRHFEHEHAEYTIAHRRWSETGVRSLWAEQKLIWSLRGVVA